MKTLIKALAAFTCLLAFNYASAGVAPPPTTAPTFTDTEVSDEEAFIGINWTLGGSLTPELEFGFRDVDVQSDGDVSGAGLSISFDLVNMTFDKIKLKGIKGDEDLQGELGGGYSLLGGHWLGTVGAQGQNFNLGLDLMQQGGIQLNGGFNTVDDYDAPVKKASCPSSYTFNGTTCVASPP